MSWQHLTFVSCLMVLMIGLSVFCGRRNRKKDMDGNEYIYTEETTKQSLPDVAALNLCLKNYDPDNWANDPQIMELRRKELELRQQAVKNNDW